VGYPQVIHRVATSRNGGRPWLHAVGFGVGVKLYCSLPELARFTPHAECKPLLTHTVSVSGPRRGPPHRVYLRVVSELQVAKSMLDACFL
jgi:hypothetical protein